MQGLVLILAMAVTVEALVEYGKGIGLAIRKGQWKTAVTYLAAICLSILLCFAANANLYDMLGVTFAWPWVGVVLTGVFASRGANFVSDLVKRLEGKAADTQAASSLPDPANSAETPK